MKKYIIFLVLLLFLPILSHVFSRDASVYAYMGTLFFDGKTPYIDGWDHKGISIYLINALGYLIGFKNFIGIRIIEITLILFSFINIYKALLVNYSKKTAFLAVAFGLISLKYFFDGGNLTEEYGIISILISLSILLKQNKKTFHYLLIGILFVVNITIRANLISFWIALFFTLMIYHFIIIKNVTLLLNKFFKIALGILIGVLAFSIYFLITDSFLKFYNAAFIYNLSYSKQSIGNIIINIIKSIRIYEVSIIILLAFLISLVLLFKKRTNFISILLLFWVPIELYFSNMSGKGFAHYYITWVPIIILSAAFIIHYFKVDFLSKQKQYILLTIIVFHFFQIPIFQTILEYKSLLKPKPNKNILIANHIKTNYKNESILIWGNECVIYNLTDKKTTIRNFYQTPFKLNSPYTSKMIIDFTNQIKQNPPDIILDVKTPSLLFLDKSNIEKIDKTQEERLANFFHFFNEKYALKETKNGCNIYNKIK